MVIWLLCDYSWCFLFVNICFFHSSGKLPSQIQSKPYSDAPDFLLNSLSLCIIEVSVHELLYIFLICLLHMKGIFAESTRQIPWHNTVAKLLTFCISVSKPQSLCFTIKNRECNLKALAPGTGISQVTDDRDNGYSHRMLLKKYGVWCRKILQCTCRRPNTVDLQGSQTVLLFPGIGSTQASPQKLCYGHEKPIPTCLCMNFDCMLNVRVVSFLLPKVHYLEAPSRCQ